MADRELVSGPGYVLTPDPLLPQVQGKVDNTVVAFLSDLAGTTGADKIGTAGGVTLQAKLNTMDAAIALGGGGGGGAPGAAAYVHTRYSNDGGLSFTGGGGTVPGAYMGTYSDNTSAASSSVSAYTWVRVLGTTGATGAAGATGPAGAAGPIGPQGIAGPTGPGGQTSYFHTAYASSADGTAGFNFSGGAYIGTYVDFAEPNSAIPAAYTWRQFVGSQGSSGAQGIPGVNGANGQSSYLHLKWSNDGGGTFTAGAGETPGAYLGTLVDTTAADSVTPANYLWKLIEGAQGPQGIQGLTGATGVSTYLHVKWSNDGGATFTASAGEIPGAYMGTYRDTTLADSLSPGAYNWGLLKGAQGDQGIPGPVGASGLPSYTHVKWSNDAGATFTSSGGEDPGTHIGVYTDSTPGDSASVSAYTWALVRGSDGAPGSAGAAGTPGASVVVAKVYIQQSATPAAPTGGSFNFSSGILTAPAGYSVARPAFNPSAATWEAQFIFNASTPGATVAGGTWSVPIKIDSGAASSAVQGFVGYAGKIDIGTGPGGTVVASVTLLSNGEIRSVGATTSIVGNWYLPTTVGIGSQYSVLATAAGSAIQEPGNLNSQISLASSVGFSLSQTGYGEKEAVINASIVKNATGLIDGSGQLTVNVVKEP